MLVSTVVGFKLRHPSSSAKNISTQQNNFESNKNLLTQYCNKIQKTSSTNSTPQKLSIQA